MKKLYAFTLLELLIGMIISSIVIGFCYMGYSLVNKRYQNFYESQKKIIDVIQLNSILNNDFITSRSARYEADNLIMEMTNEHTIEYCFGENSILRKDMEITDTFRYPAQNIIPIYIEDINTTLISAFSFETTVYDEPISFYFTKNYSAEKLLNLQLSQWPQ